MSTELDVRVRDALHNLADSTDVTTPPLAVIRARGRGPMVRRRRRLAWIAVPAVALMGAGVAVASDGVPGVVTAHFAKAHQWNSAWDISPDDSTLVASGTAPDGTQAQEWIGTSTSKAGAECQLDLIRRPGHDWAATSIGCTVDALAAVTTLALDGGGEGPAGQDSTAVFRTGPGATSVVVEFADHSRRTLDVSTSGYALLVWDPIVRAVSATAVAADGATLGVVTGFDLGVPDVSGSPSPLP
jgi:hypothetical protein